MGYSRLYDANGNPLSSADGEPLYVFIPTPDPRRYIKVPPENRRIVVAPERRKIVVEQ